MDDWYTLTAKIKANAWRQEDGKPDQHLSMLLRDRRALLETAAGKIAALAECLRQENLRSLKHTLIYTTDKGPSQLEEVNRLLGANGILFHQLTADETSNRELTKRLIRSFQDGEIQVLTAKRVLDERSQYPANLQSIHPRQHHSRASVDSAARAAIAHARKSGRRTARFTISSPFPGKQTTD